MSDATIEKLKLEISRNQKRCNLEQTNSWIIQKSEIGGRGIFATRDIKVNEIIFQDKFLICGTTQKDILLCVVCYKISNITVCSGGCCLPICEKCIGSNQHLKECQLIKSWCPKNPKKISIKIFKALPAIRALILTDDEKVLFNLLQGNERKLTDVIEEEFLNFPGDKNLLNNIWSILNTNTFEVALNSNLSVQGVYSLSCLMNHSCCPNTRISFNKDFLMTVRASKAISMGDEILTSYVQLLWGTFHRRAFLAKTKNFLCKCLRCSDPTENGTFISAIPCVDENCFGKMISSNSISLIAPWSCDVCGVTKSSQIILKVQNMISSLIGGQMGFQSIENVLNYCRNTLPKILPKFSQFSVEMKLFVIEKVQGSQFNLQDFLDKEKYCLELLDLINELKLGEITRAGNLYFELFKSRKEIHRLKGLPNDEIDEKILLEKCWMILGESILCPSNLIELKNN